MSVKLMFNLVNNNKSRTRLGLVPKSTFSTRRYYTLKQYDYGVNVTIPGYEGSMSKATAPASQSAHLQYLSDPHAKTQSKLLFKQSRTTAPFKELKTS